MSQKIFFCKWAIFLLVSICFLWRPVWSDESSLIQHVERLERQLSTLERQIYRGEIEAPKPSASLDAKSSVFSTGGAGSANSNQLQTMEHEIQRLTSSLEEAVHKIDLQNKEITTLKNDLQFRVDELEKKSQSMQSMDEEKEKPAKKNPEKSLDKKTPSKKPEPSKKAGAEGISSPKTKDVASSSSAGALPDDVITDQYNASLDLLKKKEYPAASKAFEVFLEHHGDHELSGLAQYWLGEVYFAMNDYVKSSVSFLNAYKNYPNSSKRAESLLKLGQSLSHLGKKKEACATLQKLLTDFPKASNTIKQMAESEMATNEC